MMKLETILNKCNEAIRNYKENRQCPPECERQMLDAEIATQVKDTLMRVLVDCNTSMTYVNGNGLDCTFDEYVRDLASNMIWDYVVDNMCGCRLVNGKRPCQFMKNYNCNRCKHQDVFAQHVRLTRLLGCEDPNNDEDLTPDELGEEFMNDLGFEVGDLPAPREYYGNPTIERVNWMAAVGAHKCGLVDGESFACEKGMCCSDCCNDHDLLATFKDMMENINN